MEVKKFNESITNQEHELDDFVEFFFDKYKKELGDVGSYECKLDTHKIRMSFYFMVIVENELKIMMEIYNYIKNFDTKVRMLIHYDNKYDMVECYFYIDLIAYKDICADIEILKNTEKYNV